MKKIFTLFLACGTTLGVTTLAVAQKKSNWNRSNDDCKKLSIRVNAKIDGRDFDFDKSFVLGEIYTSDDRMDGISDPHDQHGETFRGLDQAGFRKHVKYNSATGELFMQYHFKKNDEEYVYEKTVNAADKSEEERQEIIKKFEKEIELPSDEVHM